MEKMFAKPFVAALSGHMDAVSCMATSPKSLVSFVSGAADGEVKIWDLASHREVWSVAAHKGFVRGVSATPDGLSFVSCGDDGQAKLWPLCVAPDEDDGVVECLTNWVSKDALKYVCVRSYAGWLLLPHKRQPLVLCHARL
jgi:WD repeat and SOF domain-containing protein 1